MAFTSPWPHTSPRKKSFSAREKQLTLVKKINELRTAYEGGQPLPPASPTAGGASGVGSTAGAAPAAPGGSPYVARA